MLCNNRNSYTCKNRTVGNGVFCAVRAVLIITRSYDYEGEVVSVKSWLVSELRIAVVEARGQFGNSKKVERKPSEAVSRRLVKEDTAD